MSFYGDMPDMYTVILNKDHKLIRQVLDEAGAACDAKVKPEDDKLNTLKERQAELRKSREGKKDDEVPQAEKDEMTEIDGKITETENAISGIYTEYAAGNKIVHELIDLALLQNGMLKGEALAAFIRRSVELI
jgi:molecular chaperone HtpG